MPEIRDHVHTVQYYETDRMGVTHHSSYIRWMEEARVFLLSQLGWDYAWLEAMGLISPVVSISCDYKKPTGFGDTVSIHVDVEEMRAVSVRFSYVMRNQDGETVFTASSLHASLDKEGRPARLRRDFPGVYESLKELEQQTQA